MNITMTDSAGAQTITSLMLLSAEYNIVLNELSQCSNHYNSAIDSQNDLNERK